MAVMKVTLACNKRFEQQKMSVTGTRIEVISAAGSAILPVLRSAIAG